jgi:hypothetical protein
MPVDLAYGSYSAVRSSQSGDIVVCDAQVRVPPAGS